MLTHKGVDVHDEMGENVKYKVKKVNLFRNILVRCRSFFGSNDSFIIKKHLIASQLNLISCFVGVFTDRNSSNFKRTDFLHLLDNGV